MRNARTLSAALLLLLCLVPFLKAQPSGECEESELGYACKKQMTDYYALHWSLGPTTAGAEAGEGEIAIAMVGETSGWVGFAFAEEPGAMAPADFVIGWVDGGEAVVTPYRSEIRSITEDNADDAVTLLSTSGSQERRGGSPFTTIEFVRSLSDGTTPIVLDEEIPVNVAIGDVDTVQIHTQREPVTVTLNLAAPEGGTSGAAPEPSAEVPQDAPPSVPASEEAVEPPVAEPVAQPVAEGTTAEAMVPAVGPEAEMDEGCTPSDLGYSCMSLEEDVTLHWTLGPAAATGDIPETADGEVAMAISAATTGWVAVSFAQSAGAMVPADVILGWVDGETAVVRAYAISGARNVAEDQETNEIGLRDTAGTEVDGVTTLHFVLDGRFTFPVDLTGIINMNRAVGPAGVDALQFHSTRGSFSISLLSGASEEQSQDLKYYKAHGSCMIIAWIGLAPAGLLVARNKYAFKGISQAAWFQIHRAVQIMALLFMICGLIIALAEFDDPATEEGKRHRRVGISIIVIGLVQGCIPLIRPHPEDKNRHLFNCVHWWLGRGAVVLGISTVFLGIKAFDIINDDDVDQWWITCVVILGVYFGFAAIGEFFVTMKRTEDEQMKHKKEDMPSHPDTSQLEMS